MSDSPLSVLRIPEFRNFIMGRFVFIMGLRMTGTVIGWWMYQLTGSALALGFVGLAEVIPALSLALYAGHHIDKTEKSYSSEDIMLLYTDGVIEATNVHGEEFGVERLKNVFFQYILGHPKQIGDKILEELYNFTGSKELNDDYSFIIIKFV